MIFKWKVTKYICSSEVKGFWCSIKNTCELNSLQKNIFLVFHMFWSMGDIRLKCRWFLFNFCSLECASTSDLRFYDDFRRLKSETHLFRIKIEKKKDFLNFWFFQLFKLEMSDLSENVLTRLSIISGSSHHWGVAFWRYL